MEQQVHTPEEHDYRQYDRIWQRVAPELEPYPGLGKAPGTLAPVSVSHTGGGTPPALTAGYTATPNALVRQEQQLPGAEADPCCMGSAAAEMLEVLGGFTEQALADRRCYLALVQQAPAWARQRLREMAAEQACHARRLMAVHYLITGECYRPVVRCEHLYVGRWCPALRQRYHEEACNGFNYARAADGTTDICLAQILSSMSTDAYRHAGELLGMLERSLRDGM